MILLSQTTFQLHTAQTSYIFSVTQTGHLEHLYYGKALGNLSDSDIEAMTEKVSFPPGNMISYDPGHPTVTLENLCLEMSSYGKGDIREPMLELIHADGSTTCDFLFRDARIQKEKPPYETLPGSYGISDYEHLVITLKEAGYGLLLELHYYVYEACDVICRSAKLINASDRSVDLERFLSFTLDLSDSGYVMTTFTGAWAREMQRTDTPVLAGTHSISSIAGSTSSRANPFFMLSRPGTSETAGECYAFNLIYSGNHYEAVQVNAFGKTRVLGGISPAGFHFSIGPGESFEAPEAILSFSETGHAQLSLQMQRFIREHIIRGPWQHQERPILINSWEAFYFHYDEERLLHLAKAAADVGIELFVLDDGWFGNRNDASSSLGDWTPNLKKLPGGLSGLSKKLQALGLSFGIWIEPEMVSVDSDLYRAHPDWAMEVPGQPHSEGRQQRILDLANPAVTDYLIETLTEVFSSADISYVKWDMNRMFSDTYSPYLARQAGVSDPEGITALHGTAPSGESPKESVSGPRFSQGETAHRYILGLYRLLSVITERFPNILFEGCAAGGGRFDPGMLCYFPQIWGSDNTDPLCRVQIQEGYSYGYPLSCIGAHVSASPNHQTLRRTPTDTRFAVAAFGILGYECDLTAMSDSERKGIARQIALYKRLRSVLQGGDFYRLSDSDGCGTCAQGSPPAATLYTESTFGYPPRSAGHTHRWLCVSGDRSRAVGLLLQELVQPNTQYHIFKAAGLKRDVRYHFYNLPASYDIREFSDPDAAISRGRRRTPGITGESTEHTPVQRQTDTEEYVLSGAVLMNCGVKLTSTCSICEHSGDARFFGDFESRLYVMEECNQSS